VALAIASSVPDGGAHAKYIRTTLTVILAMKL